MRIQQPECINEGTARGSDDVTDEIVDLGEEFAVVNTRSVAIATIVIIHARRDVESISTSRTRTIHTPCVTVVKVSGRTEVRGVFLAGNTKAVFRSP